MRTHPGVLPADLAGVTLRTSRRVPSPSARPSRQSDSPLVKEDTARTRRDIRAAVIFGVIAATIELGVLIYFFH